VLAKIIWLSPLCLVDVGEALGLRHTLQWVTYLGFDDVKFSLASKVVIDAFNGVSNNNNDFGTIHCRTTIQQFISLPKIEFSLKQTNEIVHELTQTTILHLASIIYYIIK